MKVEKTVSHREHRDHREKVYAGLSNLCELMPCGEMPAYPSLPNSHNSQKTGSNETSVHLQIEATKLNKLMCALCALWLDLRFL